MANEKTVILKKITHQDLPEIQKMERAVYPNPWSEKSMASSIQHSSCHGVKMCSADGAQVLGYAFLLISCDDAELLNLTIKPEHQAQGLGEKLLRQLLSMGKEAGVKRVFLEVRKSNIVAIKLYQKLGFQSISDRKNYYHHNGVYEDAAIMCFKML